MTSILWKQVADAEKKYDFGDKEAGNSVIVWLEICFARNAIS